MSVIVEISLAKIKSTKVNIKLIKYSLSLRLFRQNWEEKIKVKNF